MRVKRQSISAQIRSQAAVEDSSAGRRQVTQTAFNLQENQVKLCLILPVKESGFIHHSGFDTVYERLL
jgi:hypothetical protein